MVRYCRTLVKLNHNTLRSYVESSNSAQLRSVAAQASSIAKMETRLEENVTLVKAIPEELRRLCSANKCVKMESVIHKVLRFDDSDYFKTIGARIFSFMQRIWYAIGIITTIYPQAYPLKINRMINFMTYRAVISLQNIIPAQLERSWRQEPAILDDALRRVTPIHLEFLDSWEVCQYIQRFMLND